MGMAASQARLLTLTARLHDVEHSAQSIQHAKLQLATQQDDAYEAYQRALDATSLTFLTMDSSGRQSNVVANFNNLFALNGANASGHNYALIDSRGRVIVSDEIEQGYDNFMNSNYTKNAYVFAMYMLYGGNGFDHRDIPDPPPPPPLDEYSDIIHQIVNKINDNIGENGNQDSYLQGLLENAGILMSNGNVNINAFVSGIINGNSQIANDILNHFFRTYSTQMFNEMEMPNEQVAEFNYYVRMFNAIQQHGGCISITDFDGPDGSAATNSEWLTAMIQSGQFTIELFSQDNQTLHGTSVADDTVLSYTTTTQIDKVALAKAEAEYEHELKRIDRKDKKFDMDLSKLEAERSALTKQYDSLKKVVDDNIERTFGIFS